MRLAIGWPAGNMSMTSEVAVPAGASVKAQLRKTLVPLGPRPTASDGLKSSLVLLRNAIAVATVFVETLTAPYRTVGKPTKSKAWVNQIEGPSKWGEAGMLPSDGPTGDRAPG